MDVVIVGAGQAGFQVAASLRDDGFEGGVTLVGLEAELPYQRPPLSKAYLSGSADGTTLQLRPPHYFAERRIEVVAGTRATAIDRGRKHLLFETREPIPYDHLVLATGARNRLLSVPGVELDGVVQLRDIADADRIKAQLGAARRVAIIGAGFIGLEFAAVAAARGLEVVVVEATDRPMSRALSPEMSGFFRHAHEQAGVRFEFGAIVDAIEGEGGRASGVTTLDGRRVAADLVLVGIGVIPNEELASAAGLEVSNGIRVDEMLLTHDSTISAVGDCACHPSQFAATPIRIESVQNAVDQGRCVAARLTGRAAPYASLPWFWSDQGRCKLQIAGLSMPHDRAVLRGEPDGGAFSVFCFADGRLVGVESVNRPADHMIARKLLASGIALTPGQAADPSADLRAMVAGR